LSQLKSPHELIAKTIERSRDRFLRELFKLESHIEQSKFFTEEGLKERKEKLKLKMLMSKVYGPLGVTEVKSKEAG
jgi:hypothetical protein